MNIQTPYKGIMEGQEGRKLPIQFEKNHVILQQFRSPIRL